MIVKRITIAADRGEAEIRRTDSGAVVIVDGVAEFFDGGDSDRAAREVATRIAKSIHGMPEDLMADDKYPWRFSEIRMIQLELLRIARP